MLRLVQIPDAARRVRDYPHQFSGGMRQRVMIAMALCCRPQLLIADEPTTALDVTIQAQILELLADMKGRFGMAIMLITHAMGVVAEQAQRVVVMYAGKVVEEAPVEALFANPRHPYTQGLIRSIPRVDARRRGPGPAGADPRHGAEPARSAAGLPFRAALRFAIDACRRRSRRCARGAPATARPASGDDAPLLSVRGLTKHFPIHGGVLGREVDRVHAVDGVSFDIAAGETLGLVGESGCGKSTTGRCIMRLIEPTAGDVRFEGRDVTELQGEALRGMRRRHADHLPGPVRLAQPAPHRARHRRRGAGDPQAGQGPARPGRAGGELLETVGLQADHMHRFAHEFSGGQRQRIGIARALAVRPKLVVCDEPVSALDVSVQAQVINLLEDLQEKFGLTYLFIAHDLSVVEHISDRVAVMYLGRVVEIATARALYDNPRHPYTEALLSAVPIPDPTVKRQRIVLQGDVPNPIHPPSGCHFHTRCPIAEQRCREAAPPLAQGGDGHWVACHLRQPAGLAPMGE